MGRFLTLLVLVGLFFASCVPNKRLVYLQKDEPERDAVTQSDSSVRVYQTQFSEYMLQPNDVISIRIASITPKEFDFVQNYEEQLGLIRRLNQYDQSLQTEGSNQRNMNGGNSGSGLSSLVLDRQQTGFILDSEGMLELPYIGKIKLSEKTIAEAETELRKNLLKYFETPVVRVQLLSFQFTILGEVNNEGRYTTYDPNSTIIDAIILAGNLTEFADRSKIKVVRTVDSKAEVVYVNTLREELLQQNGFYLKPNDLIIVAPLQARETRKYILPTYSTVLGVFGSLV
ncbi:polysaccharide biosynthesis/export family protein, partial [Fulvivirga lutimaris]|uniref:polysaccharide biosynthesis/export family protein n=1 Tax=Fulvivirga lutimaris TaxID=1819566 RepID=UPI0012BBD4ED